MLAPPRTVSEAAAHCGPMVEILAVDLDDSWTRDSGPIFIKHPNGTLGASVFHFNAWGGNSSLINVDGVKIYLDGVPNAAEGGSPMIDRYASAPTFGTPSIDEATLSTWFLRFDAEGLKVMGHATGSLSVRHYLNALEATRRANGAGPRHHMAHSMLIYPDEVERFNFERSNFVAEVSPYQLWTPDPAIRGWFESIGRDRMDLTFTPLKTIIDAGAVVSYGSDWDNRPEPDPWFAIEGMITRQYPGRPELGRLNPAQRLDRETVIGIFTRNGAMLMGTEDETGTIEVGKSADFIVIDRNILEVLVEKIHETRVLQTVLRGKTVYKR